MPVPLDMLDHLLKHYPPPDDRLGPKSLVQLLSQALVERALQGEYASNGKNSDNTRTNPSDQQREARLGRHRRAMHRNDEFES